MPNPSTKICSLSLKNFTVFEEATFEFSPGINILIGENATGKSYLMKIIYTLLKTYENAHQNQILSDSDKFKYLFNNQLHNIFKVGDPKKFIRLNAGMAEVDLNYTDIQFHVQIEENSFSIQYESKNLPNPSSAIYLPAQEFLSINKGFIAAYHKRELPYDETYYDLALALNALPLRDNNLVEVQDAIEILEKAIAGEDWNKKKIIKQENGNFYFDLPEGYLDVHLVADGYRKIGTLLYLLRNGSLTKDSILFWDEPETNLNPKLIIEVRKVLQALAKTGMQIFITTHDYLLGFELSLLAEYLSDNPNNIKFFSLYKPSIKSGVIVESGPTLAHIDHNSILKEFASHHDREGDLFYALDTAHDAV